MKFSVAWMREWVDPPVDVPQLAHQLTMAGLEVDSVEPVAGPFGDVVVGLVQERVPHPDADKLGICRVDLGDGEVHQIICGASNVAAGMKVAVARIGAQLPGGMRIKRAKLRGVESFGMICSEAELGLADSSNGIMVLPTDAVPGEDLRSWMGLDDHAIDVDLTPDRGDCLSIAGIAREVGVINQQACVGPQINPAPVSIEDRVMVEVEEPADCPRYLCRVICGVQANQASPLWLRERLRRSGLRSIGLVVDVTNYVMLELGQPMHAFDLAQIDGGVRVRKALPDEKLAMLDGSSIDLRPDTLVIADHQKSLAIAGVMGGLHSGMAEDTHDILLESAFFAPRAIIGKARSYGLHTDSSHRFERGVDSQLQRDAIERATGLILDLAGGQAGPIVECLDDASLPAPNWIELRHARLERLLGIQIPTDEVRGMLERLGMDLVDTDDGWCVRAPSSRFDITIEVDLIEEVGRIYGYDRIPITQGQIPGKMRSSPETRLRLATLRSLLVDRDYQEAITYSFVDPKLQCQVDPERTPIPLANPISADLSVMRTSLWPGLLNALRFNQARQQERVRLFESGLRFVGGLEDLRQESVLAGVICGPVRSEQWGSATRTVDFFDLKGDVEVLLGLNGCPGVYRFVAAECPSLHPGQSARIYREQQPVGWLGMLHPGLLEALHLRGPVYLFEIDLEALGEGCLPQFSAPSAYPSTRRDLALVVQESIPYDQVLAAARKKAPQFLRDISLFDVYNGENIESGRTSFALSLIFQDSEGNLNDAQVDQAVAEMLRRLEEQVGARLRE